MNIQWDRIVIYLVLPAIFWTCMAWIVLHVARG